jgi:hypothetical protein
MTLAAELQKPEYANLSNAERLAALHGVKGPSKLWRIEGAVRKTQVETSSIIYDTEDRLADIIEDSAASDTQKALAKKILRALKKLYEQEFYINLGDAEVAQMFNAAQHYNVLLPDEVSRITQAATYEGEFIYQAATIKDVIQICTPELIADDSWHQLDGLQSGRKLRVMLSAEAPAQTYISVQMSEDGLVWFHATALHGVHAVRPYYADLPNYGQARFIRWRCEYVLAADVSVV